MIKLGRLLLLSASLLIAGNCFAQENYSTITLIIPEIKTISVNTPRRVAISNPKIADIQSTTISEVVISPKSAGKTTLVIWDKRGQRSYSIRVMSEDLEEIKLRIDKLSTGLGYHDIYSKISQEEDKVLLLGNIDSEEEKAKLDSVLSSMSSSILDMVDIRPDKLVQIDVEILEISKSAGKDLGFDWTSELASSEKHGTAIEWTEQADQLSNDRYHLGQISRIWDRGAIRAKLNLLITEGKGRVLSRPKLVCLSGKEAHFLVGGEIPVVTTTGFGEVNVEYKEYGISLDVQPTVKPGGFIYVSLKTEVSKVSVANAVTATDSGIEIPGFVSRKAETELYLRSGQTVFIAGLLDQEDTDSLSKIPALASIPILGALFRSKSFDQGETELIISLTPKILDQTIASIDSNFSSLPKTLDAYTRLIQKRITKAIVYPPMAHTNNAQGVVLLSLHILADGRLLNAVVNKSSGEKVLDDAVVKISNSQAPFPPIPASSNLEELWIDIPIVFKTK